MKKISIATAAAVLLLAGVGLSGCAASSAESKASDGTKTSSSAQASSSQSHLDACKIVLTDLSAFSEAQSNAAASMTDPSKATAALDAMNKTFTDLTDKVGNPAVKKTVTAAAGAVSDYTSYTKSALKDPASVDTTELTSKLTAVSDSTRAIATECANAG